MLIYLEEQLMNNQFITKFPNRAAANCARALVSLAFALSILTRNLNCQTYLIKGGGLLFDLAAANRLAAN